MKEDLDLIIEYKLIKRYEFDTFISDIEKLPSNKEIKLALYQGNELINVYKTFFDKNYERWLKDLLLLSIEGRPYSASTFDRWYLGVTDPDKT